jgi:ABC-type amino acid transport substrate-binding protein
MRMPARPPGAPVALARAASTALWLFAAQACGLPRDADGTLDRVRGGVLRVGVEDAPPWVVAPPAPPDAAPRGVEPALAEGLARELGARPEWRRDSEARLLTALHRRELDLVVAGLTDDSPWKGEVALTKPYAEDADGGAHVLATPAGENAWMVRVERYLRGHGRAAAHSARARPAGVSR